MPHVADLLLDILNRTPLPPDRRLSYGPSPSQFADLFLPKSKAPSQRMPLVVFFHGGWWTSGYDLTHASFFCSALRDRGIAVYSLEYRRVGSTGGGWPATFLDVAQGFDYLEHAARDSPLDLGRVLVAGHSAGAHLAFWLLGRQHIVAGSAIAGTHSRVVPIGAVSLAGVVDLGLTLELAQGQYADTRHFVERLMGGSPEQVPDRYLAGDPGHLLPLNVQQQLLQGTEDAQVAPGLPRRWAEKAQRLGDHVTTRILPGVGHLDLIDPETAACEVAIAAIRQMLAM